MSEPIWPTSLRGQRLIESSRVDHEDGYEFSQSIGIEYENGVETVWKTSGRVYNRSWGSEQVIEMSVTNMPPHMELAHTPARIDRKIIRGKKRGTRFEVTFEDKWTYADGTTEFKKEAGILDRDVEELVNAPQAEVDEALRASLDRGESMGRFPAAKRLITRSEDGG